jgi:hypothetical protein
MKTKTSSESHLYASIWVRSQAKTGRRRRKSENFQAEEAASIKALRLEKNAREKVSKIGHRD